MWLIYLSLFWVDIVHNNGDLSRCMKIQWGKKQHYYKMGQNGAQKKRQLGLSKVMGSPIYDKSPFFLTGQNDDNQIWRCSILSLTDPPSDLLVFGWFPRLVSDWICATAPDFQRDQKKQQPSVVLAMGFQSRLAALEFLRIFCFSSSRLQNAAGVLSAPNLSRTLSLRTGCWVARASFQS